MQFCFALLLPLCVLPAAVYTTWNRDCITKPVGFGYKTTGGEGGETVQPRNISELSDYLKSSEKLIIDLTTTFDYTDSEGSDETSGCTFQECGSGAQLSLQHAGTCEGRGATEVKYKKAGVTELIVGSNKSIISSNGKGIIKGKGLRVKDAKNVIIRDITISDINPEVIWAGDALAFDSVENVWVHRCTFARIGRQHLVTYQQTNKGITVSSCFFDGTSTSAAYCDGKHYWLWLFWGTHDEITLINNHVYNTAGRTPHAGGWSQSLNFVHMIANFMDVNTHGGIEPKTGALILSEGNRWTSFTNPINKMATGGYLAMVNDAAGAEACVKYLGAECLINEYDSESKSKTWFDAYVLDQFSKLDEMAVSGARSSVSTCYNDAGNNQTTNCLKNGNRT